MPNLKDLKNRIKSVKSTQKITKAMKMVAAAKLRRATENAQAARPYAARMESVVQGLAGQFAGLSTAPSLLVGTGRDEKYLVIVATADRGLCGGFNGTIIRQTRRLHRQWLSEGKDLSFFMVGRKGRDILKNELGARVVGSKAELGKKTLSFEDAQAIANQVLALIEEKQFDKVFIVYNHFKSAISQVTTTHQLMPLAVQETTVAAAPSLYEYEPEEEQILADLLPRNLAVQIYKALLENAASEQGARMTAMDNATRNAGEMIKGLTLQYNRTRQAYITKELIEIISGAEAV